MGSVSLTADEICNLRILKGEESAKSARMPNRSCKSLAKSIFVFAKWLSEKSWAGSEGGSGLLTRSTFAFGHRMQVKKRIQPIEELLKWSGRLDSN